MRNSYSFAFVAIATVCESFSDRGFRESYLMPEEICGVQEVEANTLSDAFARLQRDVPTLEIVETVSRNGGKARQVNLRP